MHSTTPSLPPRIRIRDSLGRTHSLGTGAEAFDLHPAAPTNTRLLVLGLGPYTPSLPPEHGAALQKEDVGSEAETGTLFVEDIGAHYTDICWLDCPDFHAALLFHAALPTEGGELQPDHATPPVPSSWRRVTPAQALAEAPHRDIRLYRQNLRLFPEFWGPLWADISRQRLRLPLWPKASPTVLLLHEATALLARELDKTFADAGFQVLHWPPATTTEQAQQVARSAQGRQAAQDPHAVDMAYWRTLLSDQRPALALSINGQGLDAGGELFHLLHACQVPVALWFVDNPWHILSRFRLPWWREAQLFCTDAAFIQPLKNAGATRVAHIPLAVAPHMWAAQAYASPHAADIPHGPLETVLFVGSLAFPQRQAFFGAASVPPALLQKAFALLEGESPTLPHAGWWAERLHPDRSLWPGHAVREVGLGAEECTLRKRLLWLQAAAQCGLCHYGQCPEDSAAVCAAAGCTPSLEQVVHSSRPPVDYYASLPRLYATAPYTLNITSLLLPHGLTQRHFDVWAAGGFLLTDDTAGLDIFPQELTAEIRVPRPSALAAKIRALNTQATLRRDVQVAWQQHLRSHHGYAQRVARICEHMQIGL